MSCIFGLWVLACWLPFDAELSFLLNFPKFSANKTKMSILAAGETNLLFSLKQAYNLSKKKKKKSRFLSAVKKQKIPNRIITSKKTVCVYPA